VKERVRERERVKGSQDMLKNVDKTEKIDIDDFIQCFILCSAFD
jgi:hypothetical protein